jgi:hypothetical protein
LRSAHERCTGPRTPPAIRNPVFTPIEHVERWICPVVCSAHVGRSGCARIGMGALGLLGLPECEENPTCGCVGACTGGVSCVDPTSTDLRCVCLTC